MKPTTPDKIRNVALISHGGAGKTSLAEAMLFDAGAIQRLGSVDAGTATLTLRLPTGSTNRVQYITDLTDTAWIDLPGDVIVDGSNSLTNKVDVTLGAAV